MSPFQALKKYVIVVSMIVALITIHKRLFIDFFSFICTLTLVVLSIVYPKPDAKEKTWHKAATTKI